MIPNFFDLASNLPFAIIALAGLRLCRNHQLSLAWSGFFGGLFMVALGSIYYHWDPNDDRLVWDRLPMTISFMSLFVALLSETVTLRHEKTVLTTAILIGVASVVYWRYMDDLRFYGFIQFGVLSLLPLLLMLHKRPGHRYLIHGLILYILAKVFELNDQIIFDYSEELISGHTIKHLLAAAACYCVYRMLAKRVNAIK